MASLVLTAQDLTGIWRGIFYNEYEMLFYGAKYRYEVQIKTSGLQAKGVTYSYQATTFYGKASLVGKWTPATNNLTIVENKMLEIKSKGGNDGCLMTCYLRYRKEGEREFLEGTYSAVSAKNDTAQCGGGVVRLEKVQDSDFALEDFLKEPAAAGKSGVKPGQDKYLINKPTPKSTTPGSGSAKTNTPQKPATANTKTPAPKSSSQSPAKKPAPVTPPATGSSSTAKSNPPKNTNSAAAGSKTPTAPNSKPGTGNAVAKDNPPAQQPAKTNTNPVPASGTNAKAPVVSNPAPTQASASKTTEAVAKPKPTAPAPPPVLKERKNELVETISTAARKLDITFYDNGEIDGDTITVYANNRLVVSKKGLSAEPITISVALDNDDPIQEIVMV
ncbi:MAG TPA: hypothetical protein VLL95_05070, partial [Phnomibacter sp.]|nr:hypothetical protein [Phnomibacter sp.]